MTFEITDKNEILGRFLDNIIVTEDICEFRHSTLEVIDEIYNKAISNKEIPFVTDVAREIEYHNAWHIMKISGFMFKHDTSYIDDFNLYEELKLSNPKTARLFYEEQVNSIALSMSTLYGVSMYKDMEYALIKYSNRLNKPMLVCLDGCFFVSGDSQRILFDDFYDGYKQIPAIVTRGGEIYGRITHTES